MWSVARYDLALTSQEFYSLTPRHFDALVKRKERESQENEFLFAQLTSCVVNFSMSRPKEPVSTADFMPSEWEKKQHKEARPRHRMTSRRRQQVADQLRAVMATFNPQGA